MDRVLSVLTSFPPETVPTSDKQYDQLIKEFLGALGQLSSFARPHILKSPGHLLELLDPAANSIAYLAVLETLHSATDSERSIERGELLDKTLSFFLQFDPYQVRYAGQTLLALLDKVGAGNVFSPLVSVETLATAILKLDPTGSMFSSSHLTLARLAFDTNSIEPALQVIDRDIVFFPNMADAKNSRPLCDKELSPTSYISTSTGLTSPVKSTTVLEYYWVCGLIYTSRRDWAKARKAFERVITHPVKDRGVSKVMAEAHKKWLLAGHLENGQEPTMPSYASGSAKTVYNTTSSVYITLSGLLRGPDFSEAKAIVDNNLDTWHQDGNYSMMAELVRNRQKWQIFNLRWTFDNVTIAQIRSRTCSLETGKELESDEAVVELVRDMIASGMLKGDLESGSSAAESYVSFRSEEASMTEGDFAREVATSHYNIQALAKQYHTTNERLSGSKEYVKHMSREQKRADQEKTDGPPEFETQIEDEDLMTGIVANA